MSRSLLPLAVMAIAQPALAQESPDAARLRVAIEMVREEMPPAAMILADTQSVRVSSDPRQMHVVTGLESFASVASDLGWQPVARDSVVECTFGWPDDCWLPDGAILVRTRTIVWEGETDEIARVLVAWSKTNTRDGERIFNSGLSGQSFVIEVGRVDGDWRALRIVQREMSLFPDRP